MQLDEADPIWGAMPARVEQAGDGRLVRCPRSGFYRITGTAISLIPGLSSTLRARLTTWIVDQNRAAPDIPAQVTSEVIERLPQMPAMGIGRQMDRFLLCLAHIDWRPDNWLAFLSQMGVDQSHAPIVQAWTECRDDGELFGLAELMDSAGWLSGPRVTAKGFLKMEELQRTSTGSTQAFVAMWFDDQLTPIYDDAIEPAISACGFQAVRIDRKDHINKIDDEIIAEIRRSKFVVADFTCGVVSDAHGEVVTIPRGGVYYEAGFAQGLGIPVIWTVRDDQIGAVHFDTRQFNHIAWTTADDLKTRLTNRIRAIFQEAL